MNSLRFFQHHEARIVPLFLACLILGMFFSKAMMSIAVIGLLAQAILQFRFKDQLHQFFGRSEFWIFSVICFAYLLGGLWSTDSKEWIERLSNKLPFFALPFVFASLPRLSTKIYLGLQSLFVLILCGISLYLTWNYLNDPESAKLYARGQTFATPINHIRFSLMVAFAMAISFVNFYRSIQFKFSIERWLWLLLAGFLLIFLHIYAVRSGLVIGYLCLAILLLYFIIQSKKFLLGFGMVLLFASLPFIAYQQFESFRNKVAYVKFDLYQNLKNENDAIYSDSRRGASIKLGWNLVKENWLIGVGTGDIKEGMREQYRRHAPQFYLENPTLIHNQFLMAWASVGLLGFLAMKALFVVPLFKRQLWKNPIFICVFFGTFVACMVEMMLEVQLGIALFLTLVFLEMNRSLGAEAEGPCKA